MAMPRSIRQVLIAAAVRSTQGQVGAHDTEHNNAVALADYHAAL
jgi:hypothetical protein